MGPEKDVRKKDWRHFEGKQMQGGRKGALGILMVSATKLKLSLKEQKQKKVKGIRKDRQKDASQKKEKKKKTKAV